MSQKTLIIVIVGFFLIAALAGGVYFYFTLSKPQPTTPSFTFKTFPPTGGEVGQPPVVQTTTTPVTVGNKGELSALISEPVIGGTLSRDGNNVFYILRENGNIYRIGFDGKQQTRLSNTTIVGIYSALWSPDKTRVYLAYERNNDIKKIIFDLSASTTISSIIPGSIRSVSWSQQGKTLNLLDTIDTGVRLLTGNQLGQNSKELLKIPLGDLNIIPSSGDSLFFTEAPSGVAESPLFQLNQKTGLFKEVEKGFGLGAIISTNGDKALISQTDSTGRLQPIKIVTLSSGSEISISIRTLAEKCAWQDEDIIWCGVPKTIPENALMPDDYYKGTVSLDDELIRIDSKKQEATSFGIAGYDMQDLFLSPDAKNIFFRDQKTDYLYEFSLP